MGLKPKQRQNRETPAAQAEARQLKERAGAALHQGMPAQAMAAADAVMAAHVDAGPAGEPYLTARQFRAIALGELGQHGAAAGEHARLIEDAGPVLGDRDPRVVKWRIARAGQLAYLGRYDEAEAECRTAMKQSKKVWPHNQRDTCRLTAISQLVTVLNWRGVHDQAESARPPQDRRRTTGTRQGHPGRRLARSATSAVPGVHMPGSRLPWGIGRRGLGHVAHDPLLSGPVAHNPQTLAPSDWGAWATTPILWGLWATSPTGPRLGPGPLHRENGLDLLLAVGPLDRLGWLARPIVVWPGGGHCGR
jgi:hypothetical protein